MCLFVFRCDQEVKRAHLDEIWKESGEAEMELSDDESESAAKQPRLDGDSGKSSTYGDCLITHCACSHVIGRKSDLVHMFLICI